MGTLERIMSRGVAAGIGVLLLCPTLPTAEAAELKRYEPRLEIVREGEREYAYDAGLVDPTEGRRIADYFYREFGEDESPDVFRFPDVDGFFLVSGSQDHRGEQDGTVPIERENGGSGRGKVGL